MCTRVRAHSAEETIHHHETEEVTRLKVHERHVHHVQHHVQVGS